MAVPESAPSAAARTPLAAYSRALPALVLAAASLALAWIETGSIAAGDWLPYAVLAGLLLAVVLVSGDSAGLRRVEQATIVALLALAAWDAISLTWSAAPSLARDEAILTTFYAIAFALPLLTLRSVGERLAVTAAVGFGSAALAIAAAVTLRYGANQADHFDGGRLSFPIAYQDGLAAAFLVGFWPAVLVAARRTAHPLLRAAAIGGAAAIVAGALATQSKGAAVALAVSALFVFALSPLRLRLLVPALLAVGAAAAAAVQLTRPFRIHGSAAENLHAAFRAASPELIAAVRDAGGAILIVAAVGAVVGLAYALLDRRLALRTRTVRLLRFATLIAVCAAAVAALAFAFVRVHHPVGYAQGKWRDFKTIPKYEDTSSHFSSLGSARYDSWRVALDDFIHHPVKGIGSRGFLASYRQQGQTTDDAARSHSFELDALSETGLVGFLLLVVALILPCVVVARRARAGDVVATAAFGAAVYWIVHASVDWIWTFPACGVPFFLLLGVGTAGGERRRLAAKAAIPAALCAVLVVIVAFVPPLLSARLSQQAFSAPNPSSDLRWAKRLDPLSIAPYEAQAARAPTARASAAALAAAARKEPRSVELRYELGLAYKRAHRLRAARAELLRAKHLYPVSPDIDLALRHLDRR